MKDVVIACVGKPSAGKSSFLNAVTDATAKVGNYPFTTITPNNGVAYFPIECPCKRFNKSHLCSPRYGRCIDGKRYVPIQIMDVAGLVPGASEGQGLGNQFLDDLRHANALIHVVDASGTTDANGKETVGYDPIGDIEWLRSEIHSWIFGNLDKRWSQIVRRHVAVKASTAETLHNQLSGYGATLKLVQRTLDRSGVKEAMDTWDKETIKKVVDAFLEERFPTVFALNKIDLPDSDKNISKIMRKYDQNKVILTSALAEVFLRKLHKQKFIIYEEGTDNISTKADLPESDLKPLDERLEARIEKVQDLVLYRYGSTGVQDVILKAVEILGLIPAFPVKSLSTFGNANGKGVFRDCVLLWPGTTVLEFAEIVHPEIAKHYLGAETVGNRMIGEDDVITLENNIICFKTSQSTHGNAAGAGAGSGQANKK
ncbi:45.2 kDa GTP-binding protein [Lobosporangium transversale]|uniref:45.2 kDa GTP-binding protein n=1 Tax=Lobosporangium transversale TaxID=64571 RepID=A0A1Y2H2M3_9FUNG|nr:45.2 kDa GTP-binding protein [Lobosporangium transversale]ORZ28798.1 45.2 kDa GTP-binding protein [Lobosporangium transversale]|eukprot:XP_021886471.1 45.2 kDa GTP-binding protein [Lobosporangium transversale]